ncbi:MAG: type IV pilus assembly protein PilM [Patescibacteria group bacterium]
MSIGIDIGSKIIKIVELEKEAKGFNLLASGAVGYQGILPQNAKDDKELVALSDVVRKLHKEAHVRGKEVTIALPESLVFTRTIKFPPLSDQEVASAVKWEAEQYVPIPIAEAIIEHQIIERSQGVNAGVTVLLVACPRTLVETYIKLIAGAGLTVVGAETEVLALCRSLAPETGTFLLLDFGAQSTDIAITKNGMVNFSRSIPTAGDAFTRVISQNLGIENQQAEAYKKTYGLSSSLEGKVKGSLLPVFNIVAEEIKKAIHFYQAEEKGEVPKSIIVSGGTSSMPEAISSLSNLLEIEVVVGNPFAKVMVNPEASKTLANYAPLYSIAVGLALRGD